MTSAFERLVDLIKRLAARHAPAAQISEFPGLVEAKYLGQLAMGARLAVVVGYGGQGEVRRRQSGDAAITLSFSAFFVSRGGGNIVQAGRLTASAAIALAEALSHFTPAAGLSETAEDAGDAVAGVLDVCEPQDIGIVVDSTEALLREHIVIQAVSWTHDLIIGAPQPYPGEVALGLLAGVEIDGRDDDDVHSILQPDEDL